MVLFIFSLILLIFFFIAAFLSGRDWSGFVLGSVFQPAEQEVITHEFSSYQGSSITILNTVGDISVSSWDKDSVEVEITKRTSKKDDLKGIDVHITSNQNELIFRTIHAPHVRSYVHFRLMVPKSAHLKTISTDVGKIEVENVQSGVLVKTGVGEVALSGLVGSIDAQTGLGAIIIAFDERSDQPVVARTGSGSIKVTNSDGLVDLSTGRGSIAVGYRSTPLLGESRISTGVGALKVAVPDKSNIAFSGRVGLGTFHSSFSEVKLRNKLISGKLGSDGLVLNLAMGLGSVKIVKKEL